mmetsp:Transcript_14204/g.24150  ORF Transcript_14204/g.24150 Transcript_14204/m.24150 type:complete len:86 (+) Transcript_14204:1527-1784(+)
MTIKQSLQKMNAENNELMHLAKRACVSYLKCVYLMRDKDVFKFPEIDQRMLAESMGLPTAPTLDFLSNQEQEGAPRLLNTLSRAE